jgi:hypothetical protein
MKFISPKVVPLFLVVCVSIVTAPFLLAHTVRRPPQVSTVSRMASVLWGWLCFANPSTSRSASMIARCRKR